MLRLTILFLITILILILFCLPRADSFASLTRITNTSEYALNLNPTLSDDGQTVVFESTADLAGTGDSASFHAIRTDLAGPVPAFVEIGSTRAVCPSVSGDGKLIVFASTEDLVGRNADRNSEIFLFDGLKLNQLTQIEPASSASRLEDGSFQPSITNDGRTVVFSSKRNLFLYDTVNQRYTQLTNESAGHAAVNPKISGDGSRVYYRRRDLTTDAADLLLIDVETGTSRVLAANVANLAMTEGRAVSNDGMRLVYSASTGVNETQVFLFEGRDNSIRQVTQLGSRSVDVKLQPTISGDGRRVAFATRRRVTNASDGGVELYVFDLPSGQVQQITNAPAAATAEVISSLNFDGSLVGFSFPRILSGPVSDDDFRNNSEIYLASVAPRAVGVASVVNAAAQGHEPEPPQIAPGSIASIRGNALALKTETGDELPFTLAGTSVTVNGQAARLFYVSATEVVFVVPDQVSTGPAEFLVTNADGLSSKAQAQIAAGAPGVFTTTADGRGEAIVLNADTLMRAPFDPSSRELRLSIFATGASRAKTISVMINGKSALVETVAPARLLGIDEVHVLVPSELRGAGMSTLIVTADGVQSNPVSIVLGGIKPAPSPTPTPSPTPNPTPDSSPRIVISQIFGGGGNSGAPFRNDFIEIFNAGSSTVTLNGWSVQYASATATTWSVTPLPSVTLSPGQYYLIQESSGGSNGVALPVPDATGTIAMAAGSGKVALVKNSTALSSACPNDPNIIDFLGYGSTASCFRGSAPAAAPSNTNALLRAGNGCTDTRNNVADFSVAPPTPRNTSFLPRICADP
ncbi:MAG TPA: lamin tail domain-containing protein [Pyrinomonadaceae bacterium]